MLLLYSFLVQSENRIWKLYQYHFEMEIILGELSAIGV